MIKNRNEGKKMGAIPGIGKPRMESEVNKMLDKMVHRGKAGRTIFDVDGVTLGSIWTEAQATHMKELEAKGTVMDFVADGHIAIAKVKDGKLELSRDQLGIAPLYYGKTKEGVICFASEVKGLMEVTHDVNILPPGHSYINDHLEEYYRIQKQRQIKEKTDIIAKKLRKLLENSVADFAKDLDVIGAWLSGGLDSSTMAALAAPHVEKLYTFAAGVKDAPDLKHARKVAAYIGSDHHEVIVTFEDLLKALPEVIYHLESFDALLVRSSITNYLVAKEASNYVTAVLSGEGGDELFAGYSYLKSLEKKSLPDELIDITRRLHNTALQRVDRCSSAHSTMAHVGFLDPIVVKYVLQIPIEYKLHDGTEKWILRKAMVGSLPKSTVLRTKSKFWQGAGVKTLMVQYADKQIEDSEFKREQILPNGWTLNSKEEMLYYRIFRKHFGELSSLSWMGRTKGAPIAKIT
jgi:asparagine synthase (glutamine-hydrolysing)